MPSRHGQGDLIFDICFNGYVYAWVADIVVVEAMYISWLIRNLLRISRK
jgi:hypothetical protein